MRQRFSKREADRRVEKINADMVADGDDIGREDILERKEMDVIIGVKEFFHSDEVETEDIFVLTDDTWVTDVVETVEGKTEMEGEAPMRFRRRVELQ